MTRKELDAELLALGENYKTADLDRLAKKLIKQKADLSFLSEDQPLDDKYNRIYFQTSLCQLQTIEEKLEFIENNFDKLNDWWHVDQLSQFVDHLLTLPIALAKAKEYIKHENPFARRWGFVMFMPTLVKEEGAFEEIVPLFFDDDEYYVAMAEAWLISYLAVYHTEKTERYLASKPLEYNIVGKAIQKTCDSFRVNKDTKERFKALRGLYK